MSKIPWKFIWAFSIPLNFAIGSFYLAHLIIKGKEDCRGFDSIDLSSAESVCAGTDILFWHDFFAFSGFSLIILSLAIPLIVFSLTKKDSEVNALQKIT